MHVGVRVEAWGHHILTAVVYFVPQWPAIKAHAALIKYNI